MQNQVNFDGKPHMLSQERIAELQKDDRNEFYEYTFDKVDRVLPMEEVEEVMRKIIHQYHVYRNMDPRMSDLKIREKLVGHCDSFRTFSETHRTIMQRITTRDTPQEVIKTICGMMSLKLQQERGKMDEENVALGLQHYLKKQCASMQKKQKQEQKKKQKQEEGGSAECK